METLPCPDCPCLTIRVITRKVTTACTLGLRDRNGIRCTEDIRKKLQDCIDLAEAINGNTGKATKGNNSTNCIASILGGKKDKEKENQVKEKEIEKNAFNEWWARYPNKQGKLRAETYYRMWLTSKTPEELLSALDAYLAAKRKAQSTTYSNGATFLNPNPRGDSANISDFWWANTVTCESCKFRQLHDGYCHATMQRVRADNPICGEYEKG